jgi:hypothetical protein
MTKDVKSSILSSVITEPSNTAPFTCCIHSAVPNCSSAKNLFEILKIGRDFLSLLHFIFHIYIIRFQLFILYSIHCRIIECYVSNELYYQLNFAKLGEIMLV